MCNLQLLEEKEFIFHFIPSENEDYIFFTKK